MMRNPLNESSPADHIHSHTGILLSRVADEGVGWGDLTEGLHGEPERNHQVESRLVGRQKTPIGKPKRF